MAGKPPFQTIPLFPHVLSDSGAEEIDEKRQIFEHLDMLKILDLLRNHSEKVKPDTYGCQCLFAKYFATDEMSEDFPSIANDFLKHEFSNIGEYNTTSFADDSPSLSYSTKSMEYKIVNLMVTAAKKGSSYTIGLFQNLYKTYYKKEYKQLKRFHKITAGEVLSLIDTKHYNDYWGGDMARILMISPMFGIELHPNCTYFYSVLDDINDIEQDHAVEDIEYLEFPDNLYQDAAAEIDDILSALRGDIYPASEFKAYRTADKFISLAFRHFGYPDDFGYLCNTDNMGYAANLRFALAILKTMHPNKKYTFDEIQYYSALYFCVGALCSQTDEVNDYWDRTLGLNTDLSFSDYECQFKPDMTKPVCSAAPAKAPALQNKVTPAPVKSSDTYQQADLLAEIESLRERLHIKELDQLHLKMLYTESRHSVSELETNLLQYENEHEELVALREHVYASTEDDIESPEEDIRTFSAAIYDKRIVIIGGHDNWTNKLRSQFDHWVFLSPKTSGTIDDRTLDNADYVYFFTDFIKHCTYLRFIRIVRDRKIPFGYIHSINLKTDIRQIYHDVTGD